MNRRLLLVVAPVLMAVVASSCSTLDPPAATIGGEELDADTARESIEAFETLPLDVLGRLSVSPVAGSAVSGDMSRFWLGYMIQRRISEQTLEALGGTVSPEDLLTAQNTISADPVASDFPTVVQDELLGRIAANEAIQRVATAPEAATLAEKYAQDPPSTGAMCLSHILVATREEALDVKARLDAGADFAELAAQYSLDETSTSVGGAILLANEPCVGLQTWMSPDQGGDPDFVAGALQARPGVPTEPIESTAGWHIVLARPYEEIADSLLRTVAAAPALAAIYAGYATTDVHVASRFGRWHPGSLAVVPSS